MISYVVIPRHQVDFAWKDGAVSLSESCSDECTLDQLKMTISSGDRWLIRMDRDGNTVGWVVVRADQYPNLRALHVTNLVAHGARFHEYSELLKEIARGMGCSEIRCSAKPAQSRLYQMKCGFVPIYETLKLEVEL